jgi:hypothetical protein
MKSRYVEVVIMGREVLHALSPESNHESMSYSLVLASGSSRV